MYILRTGEHCPIENMPPTLQKHIFTEPKLSLFLSHYAASFISIDF